MQTAEIRRLTLPETRDLKSALIPYAALGAAAFFWGASFPAARFAVTLLDPKAVMFCRMAVACLIMAPFARQLKPAVWSVKDLKLVIPMVLLQPCLYFLLESKALTLTTSSQAGVISAAVPLLVALGAWLVLSEKITMKVVFGLVVSMAGVVVLTVQASPVRVGDNPLVGNCLEFGAMACAAGNLLLVKGLSTRYNTWTLTGLQFIAGLIFFSPGIVHLVGAPENFFRLDLIGVLILLGAFASVGAFGLYNWAMARIPASRAAVFINLVPVIAVVLGWTLLGESLSLGQAGGAFLVGFGVLVSQKK
nr:DMT family transporter [uncultured Desulfobacter sp.]